MHTTVVKELVAGEKTKVELADTHTHLDIMDGMDTIKEAIEYGVSTIITDGVDTESNLKALEMSDGNHIFAALGVDPEHLALMRDDELEFNFKLLRENAKRIVAIGEIGLDYRLFEDTKNRARQRLVFGKFLDLAEDLQLPVSVHSRNAIDDVLFILGRRRALRVHLHHFEGDVKEAKIAEARGYMISIPPIESGKRKRVIKEVPISMLVAETDSPAVGATPKDVERAVRMIAEIKGIDYEKAAEVLTFNAKEFFNIHKEKGFMRY